MYFLLICAFLAATLFFLLIHLNWAAANREVLGFGKNLPADGYLLRTVNGEFFLIDTYSKSKKICCLLMEREHDPHFGGQH